MKMSTTRSTRVTDIEIMFRSRLSLSSEDPVMDECSSLFSIPRSDTLEMLHRQALSIAGGAEICAKYIPMSDSTVIRHPYYEYLRVKDPGVLEALNDPEVSKVFSEDGQDLYLALCEEMNVIPVGRFHRGLLLCEIDLKYYGVNPVGVRAMGMALLYNRYVTRLDLTSNFLDEDACYHLGQMLGQNVTLQELVLSGCRVKQAGVRRVAMFLPSHPLALLDLSRNDLGDEGFRYLADQISKGAVIKSLNLSYNELGTISMTAFADAIQSNQSIVSLDLSWNQLRVVTELVRELSKSKVLKELNLSWNALKGSKPLGELLTVPTFKMLNLSNNSLTRVAILAIANNLHVAKNFRVLDVSNNPLTTADAFKLVSKLRMKEVKLTHLLMDGVVVNKQFIKECKEVLALSFRKTCKITYGHVLHDYTPRDRDIREIIFKRLAYVTAHSKKTKMDIAMYFLEKKKLGDYLLAGEMSRDMKSVMAPGMDALIDGLMDHFPGPKMDTKGNAIDLNGVVDYVSRMWPEKKLPPTPPPVLEPVEITEKKKSAKKPK